MYTQGLRQAAVQRVEDTGTPGDIDPLEDAICVICNSPEDEDQTLLCDGAALAERGMLCISHACAGFYDRARLAGLWS